MVKNWTKSGLKSRFHKNKEGINDPRGARGIMRSGPVLGSVKASSFSEQRFMKIWFCGGLFGAGRAGPERQTATAGRSAASGKRCREATTSPAAKNSDTCDTLLKIMQCEQNSGGSFNPCAHLCPNICLTFVLSSNMSYNFGSIRVDSLLY